jgi:hypothetical protein
MSEESSLTILVKIALEPMEIVPLQSKLDSEDSLWIKSCLLFKIPLLDSSNESRAPPTSL